MGELPLWHKQKFGIGAAVLPRHRKSLCLSGETLSPTMFDLIYRNADMSAAWAMGRDNSRTNAGFDIIAGYARNCGKQSRLNATEIFLSGNDPVSCAIRENIRESDGVYANAVEDVNGAKEIDCYV